MTEKELEEWHRECAYAYFLENVPGLGKKAILNLINRYGSYEAVYREALKEAQPLMPEKLKQAFARMKKTWDVTGKYNELRKRGIYCVPRNAEGYPAVLRELPDAPSALFVRGKLPDCNKPLAALIGARSCTGYGTYIARELGKRLAFEGIGVISGMARGIDGIGQWAALTYGGATFGVLGSGVDVCYPEENRELYQRLCAGEGEGGIISEFLPDMEAKSGHFPARNRIISGLADAVVVIEAKEKSGTFITVTKALEQGKDVYAVPGRLTDPLSIGCLKLIEQGAEIIWDFDLFIQKIKENKLFRSEKGIGFSKKIGLDKKAENAHDPVVRPPAGLNALQEEIYEILDFDYLDANYILCKLKTEKAAEVMAELSEMECKKIIEGEGGFYRRKI